MILCPRCEQEHTPQFEMDIPGITTYAYCEACQPVTPTVQHDESDECECGDCRAEAERDYAELNAEYLRMVRG